MPLQHRHDYAADLHRGLPTDDVHPVKEFPAPKRECALLPSPDLSGLSWWIIS